MTMNLLLKWPVRGRHVVAIGAAVLAMCAATTSVEGAALSYVGGTYTENFDSLPSTGSGTLPGKGPNYLVPGWTGASGLTGWQGAIDVASTGTNTEYRAQNGSGSGSAGRGLNSFGTTGSAERALGALPTSNQIPFFGLVLQNNTENTLTQFTLSFTGEQWRRGDTSPQDKLLFSYGLASDISASLTSYAALDFAAPTSAPLNSALDGNLPANQTFKSATITGLTWGVGQTLVLKWSAPDITGQDDGLAIDNLSFVAHAVPEPAGLTLALLAAAGALGAVWRRRVKST